jgi:argininosuccinate synthase
VDRLACKGSRPCHECRDWIRIRHPGLNQQQKTRVRCADRATERNCRRKSRGAYETPGGTLLVTAHRELESLCLDRETAHYQQLLSLRYAEMVYYGMWFTPLREALDGFFSKSQERVTGAVTLTLFRGNLTVASRRSPFSLYRTNLASFTMMGYNPKDAEGFINLFALPITVPLQTERPLAAEVK